jgi:hypothetical protein
MARIMVSIHKQRHMGRHVEQPLVTSNSVCKIMCRRQKLSSMPSSSYFVVLLIRRQRTCWKTLPNSHSANSYKNIYCFACRTWNKVKWHTAHAQLQLITASERQYFSPRSHFPLRYKRVLLLHLNLVDNISLSETLSLVNTFCVIYRSSSLSSSIASNQQTTWILLHHVKCKMYLNPSTACITYFFYLQHNTLHPHQSFQLIYILSLMQIAQLQSLCENCLTSYCQHSKIAVL